MDLYWVLKKREYVKKNDAEIITFRDFLDKTQYTNTGIFAYEWIFGDNFISPGSFFFFTLVDSLSNSTDS